MDGPVAHEPVPVHQLRDWPKAPLGRPPRPDLVDWVARGSEKILFLPRAGSERGEEKIR